MTDPSPAAQNSAAATGQVAQINDVLEVLSSDFAAAARQSAIRHAAWLGHEATIVDLHRQIAVKDQQIAALQQQLAEKEAEAKMPTAMASSNGRVIDGEVSDASTRTASN